MLIAFFVMLLLFVLERCIKCKKNWDKKNQGRYGYRWLRPVVWIPCLAITLFISVRMGIPLVGFCASIGYGIAVIVIKLLQMLAVSGTLQPLLCHLFQRLWRGETGAHTAHKFSPGGNHGPSRMDGEMGIDEARKILGVSEGATAEEIQAAYRKIIARNHPDQGGSAYLAQQINQARALLLKKH